MNPGNITAGAGALRQALQLLRLRWADTKSQWNDPVSQSFDEEYIAELERTCQAAMEQMNHLSQVFRQCREECVKKEI